MLLDFDSKYVTSEEMQHCTSGALQHLADVESRVARMGHVVHYREAMEFGNRDLDERCLAAARQRLLEARSDYARATDDLMTVLVKIRKEVRDCA